MRLVIAAAGLAVMLAGMARAQQGDSSRIGPDGTAYVTRVVPVPKTLSPEAQRWLSRVVSDAAVPQTLQQRREQTDKWQAGAGLKLRSVYPVHLTESVMAGVPVRVVSPLTMTSAKRGQVLMNLHGGGFNSDSGSLMESIPIANLTGVTVVVVLYRLAPEHPYPAALNDAVAVYKELLTTHKAKDIGIYGTSAGAILTAELTARLKQLGLPLPAVTGVFSGMGDFSHRGDSEAMYSLQGLDGHLDPPKPRDVDTSYIGTTSVTDPILSPIFGDLRGLPPTLFVTSTRDMLLSGTTILERAYFRAGNDARLIVFEALPHAFWYDVSLPESKEANEAMARFLGGHLGL